MAASQACLAIWDVRAQYEHDIGVLVVGASKCTADRPQLSLHPRSSTSDELFLTFLQDTSQAARDVIRRLAAVNVLDRSNGANNAA